MYMTKKHRMKLNMSIRGKAISKLKGACPSYIKDNVSRLHHGQEVVVGEQSEYLWYLLKLQLLCLTHRIFSSQYFQLQGQSSCWAGKWAGEEQGCGQGCIFSCHSHNSVMDILPFWRSLRYYEPGVFGDVLINFIISRIFSKISSQIRGSICSLYTGILYAKASIKLLEIKISHLS